MERDFPNVGVWLLLIIAGTAVRSWAKVKPMELPVARIAADTDKVTVAMRLQSDTTEKVTLSAGDVTLKETKDVLPATVTFDQASVALQPNQPAEVKVTVARMFAEGEATAEIRVQGEKLGELRIVRYGAGLRLQHTWLQFHKGRPTALQVKNETQFPYTVGWMMQIGAVKVCGQGPDKPCETVENWKTVTIPAKNTAIIEVEPAAAWFDRWYPGTEQARLTLAFAQAADQLPKVEMHFAANLAGSWSMMATKLQTLWIVLLLALGGLLSLLVRHWVPNSQKKRELKEHVHRVRQKIKGLSGEIDSVLRVL